MNPIRVLIADDHEMVRKGIKAWLEAETDIVVVEDISDGTEVVKKIAEHKPDVLLLDLQFPNIHGLSIIRVLREKGDDTPILIITGYEKHGAKAILEAGANGFLNKEDTKGSIIEAVRWAARREQGKWLSPSATKEFLEKEAAISKAELSKTEVKILTLIDKTNMQIAEKLFLSGGTIKNHVSAIYSKLGISRRMEAINWAREQGLLLS